MMAPAKILVGASTVGISRGGEGRVLRSLLLYGAVLLAGMTAVAWLLLPRATEPGFSPAA